MSLQRAARAAGASLLVIGAAAPTAYAQGSLVAWGDDSGGFVSGVPAGTFVAVAAGASSVYGLGGAHAVAIRANGTLVSWGDDSAGQVSGTPAGTFSAAAAGGGSCIALRTNGTIVAWGGDAGGSVSGPNADGGTFIAVAAAEWHTVAVRSDGTLVSWGIDYLHGQISGTPAGTFVAVMASGAHSLAIRTDGTLVIWGGRSFNSDLSYVPAGTFSKIASNDVYSAAIRTDGALVTWATWFDSGPSGSYIAVAAASWGVEDAYVNHFAIRADGTIQAWGDDSFGQVSGVPAGTYTAIAAAGGSCVAIASATGNQAPVITCHGPLALWSPNHALVDVSSAFNVSDPDGNPVTLTFRVFSDETEVPDTGDGTGRHAPDFKRQLASGTPGVFVRSERRGPEDGRFYIFVITADDGQGGVTTAVCPAAVCPRNQTQESLNDVLAQAASAATALQNHVDSGTLPAAPSAPPGLHAHGLSGPLGPNQ